MEKWVCPSNGVVVYKDPSSRDRDRGRPRGRRLGVLTVGFACRETDTAHPTGAEHRQSCPCGVASKVYAEGSGWALPELPFGVRFAASYGRGKYDSGHDPRDDMPFQAALGERDGRTRAFGVKDDFPIWVDTDRGITSIDGVEFPDEKLIRALEACISAGVQQVTVRVLQRAITRDI